MMKALSGEHVCRHGLGHICLHDMCSGVRGGQGAGGRVAGTGLCRVRQQTGEKGIG